MLSIKIIFFMVTPQIQFSGFVIEQKALFEYLFLSVKLSAE